MASDDDLTPEEIEEIEEEVLEEIEENGIPSDEELNAEIDALNEEFG